MHLPRHTRRKSSIQHITMASCCLFYTCSDSDTPKRLSEDARARSRVLCRFSEGSTAEPIHIPFSAQTLLKWQNHEIECVEDACSVLQVRFDKTAPLLPARAKHLSPVKGKCPNGQKLRSKHNDSALNFFLYLIVCLIDNSWESCILEPLAVVFSRSHLPKQICKGLCSMHSYMILTEHIPN